DAYARGITCVAAAGNDSTRVSFPAAFPTSIAVSAIGRFNTFPEDSAHALKVGRDVDFRGQLFAASFTNFGPEIEICAPGVAILSTVPSGYVAWDGTSFSCPMVSGLVALILEAYPAIRTGDAQQSEYVRWILRDSSLNIGLPPQIQGKGLPSVPRALAAAQYYAPQMSWASAQGYYAAF
ncbi:MAG TPA: S8 family serine peptidase, partial [Blastocatellia bacterium]|nr:S8 family serine peptidase [Blastocatellia bacterium]